MVPPAHKAACLTRYAEPGKGRQDRAEANSSLDGHAAPAFDAVKLFVNAVKELATAPPSCR